MDIDVLDVASSENKICELYDNTTHEFVINIFISSLENCVLPVEKELLHLNNLREASEMHLQQAVVSFSACKGIADWNKEFLDKNAWHNMFHYLRKKTNPYLVFAASRTISAIMYNFPQSVFEERLLFLLESVLKSPADGGTTNSLELLISLLNYSCKISYNGNVCKCDNKIACAAPSPENLFICFCTTLSLYWNSLVDTFLKVENPHIRNFLQLWKLLSEKNLCEEASSVILNNNFSVDFLPNAAKLSSHDLRLYVDIIAQTFCSSLKSGILNCLKKNALEVSVASCISGGCLDLLPACKVSSTFCTSSNRKDSVPELPMLNIILKKTIFIIFNLLVEFTNTELLCEAFNKVIEFISSQIDDWKPECTCCGIVDTFIDYDDLLFGVMLAMLRMYCNLKEQSCRVQTCNTTTELCIKELNPHKTFIKFLQQIGWCHTELLSFLLSDETCCLLYLLRYLKLLLTEWTLFLDAHEFLLSKPNVLKHDMHVQKDISHADSASPNSSSYICHQLLVSYSSSSSSDEDLDTIKECSKYKVNSPLKSAAAKTLDILIHLKEGIQKLIDVKEFPYNVQPLLNLLKTCSNKYALLI